MVRFARHLSQNSQNHDKQRVLRVFFLSGSTKRIKNVSKIKNVALSSRMEATVQGAASANKKK
jgi:hypothetical protein